MITLTLLQIIQILVFILGSILIILSGKQDEKTRRPFLLIPGLMAIGLSAGITTFLFVTLASIIIFLLPNKVNKLIGKADLLLLAVTLLIIILFENILLIMVLYMALIITIILIIINKKRAIVIPFIYYYSIAYGLTVIFVMIYVGVNLMGMLL